MRICSRSIYCGRLCKTTEIFVTNKNVLFYIIFTPTILVLGLLYLYGIFPKKSSKDGPVVCFG